MKRTKRALALGAFVFVPAVWVLTSAATSLALNEKLEMCGADNPENRVRTAFELPRARDYKQFLPGMLDNPELQTDRPAGFVVFDGPVTLVVAGPAPASDDLEAQQKATTTGIAARQYDGVVCVIIDGQAIVYANVDTTGLRTP